MKKDKKKIFQLKRQEIALVKRLGNCDIRDFDRVKKSLMEVRETIREIEEGDK